MRINDFEQATEQANQTLVKGNESNNLPPGIFLGRRTDVAGKRDEGGRDGIPKAWTGVARKRSLVRP